MAPHALHENLDPPARAFLVEFLAGCGWEDSFEVIDGLAAASRSHADLAEQLKAAFAAWPIDGPEANAARANMVRLRALSADRDPDPSTLPAPATERVARRLEAFEAGDVAAYVREHLQGDLVGRGIILNREVQLRPSVAPGTGQRTDIQIDAVAKDSARSVVETLAIVVEVKGAWNAELFIAMTSQLRDRYLTGTRVRRGIYLVGWFASPFRRPALDRHVFRTTARRRSRSARSAERRGEEG
jgi:hypothetical protein